MPDKEPTKNESAIIVSNDSQIRDMIYTVRGQQVMLDSDLAELYDVETKRLNEAVGRNKARFPEAFCFKLTSNEEQSLRSQIATSKTAEGRGGRRYLPRAFTEQGVAMLSAVLRSETAIKVSVKIMNAFVEMRHFVADNARMFEQIKSIDYRLDSLERSTNERFERVFNYMETHKTPSQKVFFEGQVYDAFELLISLVQKAKHEIVLVDGYVDTGTLNILSKKELSVVVTVWTHPKTSLTESDVATFNAQYPTLMVKHTTSFHDRFLILDGVEGYLIGASLKDAGKKSFAITKLEDSSIVESIVAALGE
ncbi:MAG: ORF6N domain-containing protein [Atopobium sp.]|uniref:ORF6N domain-containing protein n=1 Tax=Atopobium sp. TaxID=1872650 RepID=UPI002A8073A8|nr:ORF6N domain-containing protein [Atopobium sp.]MDY4522205.1 ORF6N domain-containing protein [Atopobium sp.]